MLSQNRSPLFDYAVSSLTPEIFSHPVWLRFGKNNPSLNSQIADDLCIAAKTLQNEEPGVACQILLLCAVCQNNAAQYMEAIRTTQEVRALALRTNLTREMIWTKWGEAAIYIHQRNDEQACAILAELQAALTGQNEWMLAGFIEVLRQGMYPSFGSDDENNSRLAHDQQSEELVRFTFDWLQQWGCSFEPPVMGLASHQTTHTASIRSFFSFAKWQGRWQSFKLAIQGEVKLQWTARHVQPVKEPVSVWNTQENSQESFSPIQNFDLPAKTEIHQASNNILLPSSEDSLPTKSLVPKGKKVSETRKNEKKTQPKPENATIPVAVHMLGDFAMTIGDRTLKLPSSKGLSLLKYLLLHHERTVTRDILMDTFWPGAGIETARNNLNVTIHSLRKALRTFIFLPVVIYDRGGYCFEPSLQIWLDTEEFEKRVQASRQFEARSQLTAAMREYEAAISLYRGDFLEENPYEEWTVLERERLRIAYLDTLDRLGQIYFEQERYAVCISVCNLLLARDRCREDTHCLLMRCYSRQGQHHLALRQYQNCVEVLHAELDVEPAQETTQVYNQIRRREYI